VVGFPRCAPTTMPGHGQRRPGRRVLESTATALNELLCGAIPIVIMHSLPSQDWWCHDAIWVTWKQVSCTIESVAAAFSSAVMW
jgi:hypothetical protein